MEAFLVGRSQQTVPKDLLWRVFWQFEVVHTGVDGRVAVVVAIHLAYHGQAGMQVGQPTWGQRGAAGGELQEGFALIGWQVAQHIHKPQEPRAATQHSNQQEWACGLYKAL